MTEKTRRSGVESATDASGDELVVAYRHDVHKFAGEAHEGASTTVAGALVNQPVPHGADGDAAALSRPAGQPTQTVETHATHYRLSLLTGESRYDPNEFTRSAIETAVRRLLVDNPKALHREWLDSDVASAFSESAYYPYTSLKYHTLLVAALLDNYCDGHAFADLHLVVDPADALVPHRTVYAGESFGLRIDVDHDDRPHARLGSRPWRSWATVWGRLTAHPLDTDGDVWARTLDANLRRIRSWSTALQYLEDFQTWGGRP